MQGFDYLKGKDIAVAGTFHVREFVYKLLAFQLGFNIYHNLHYQEVTYGGYKFWFTTYADEKLRNIQFWIIESELEQAVGRARLLREDCTVSLFANFPLAQAQLERWKED